MSYGAFDQPPFIKSIKNGSMIGNKIYDSNNEEVTFDPPIFDSVAKKLYLEKERHTTPLYLAGEIYTFIKAYADNYAHWIYDIFPCFSLFDYSDKKIYINASRKFQIEFLKILDIKDENIIPYPEVTGVKSDVLNFVYAGSRYKLEDFYDNFTLKLNLNCQNKNKKIYISREKSKMRKILNEDQVFKMLETRGFKKYFMEDMSVLEQIALFGSASCVVLPHGASAANLFFSPRDTRVIQFWPNRLFNSHKIYPKKLTYNNLYEKTAENDCMIVNLNRLSHIVDGTLT